MQGQLNELQANESPKPLPHFIQGQLNGLQATTHQLVPCSSTADDLDVGREEERVEASGHGRKAFLEWHTQVCTLGWAIGCFTKTLFQQKKWRIPPRISLGVSLKESKRIFDFDQV